MFALPWSGVAEIAMRAMPKKSKRCVGREPVVRAEDDEGKRETASLMTRIFVPNNGSTLWRVPVRGGPALPGQS